MSDTIFKGCGTALLTPFKEDLSIDYDAYARLVERQVEGGVDFLVPLGTSAETPTLSREEKRKILSTTREHAHGRALLVGCGSNSVDATLENMELLEDADAFLVVVPFYNKPTQEGQYQYFKAVSEATDKPIVIYNVPGRTGANMSAETCLRLANDCPNIIATKEASGNYAQVSAIIASAPEGFSVLSGDDDLTFAFMATGAQGVISVASNIAPREVVDMVNSMLSGDLARARALHHRLFPLFKACFVESNPIPAKAAMAYLGLMEEEVRLPLSRPSEATKVLMKQTLDALWQK